MTDINTELENIAAEVFAEDEEQLTEIAADAPKKGAAPAEPMAKIASVTPGGEVQDMGPAVVSPDAPTDPGEQATKKAAKAKKPGRDGKGQASNASPTPMGDGSGDMKAGTREEVEPQEDETIEETVETEDSIDERISAMDFSDDAQALAEGEDDLSDEFKKKAATILEAAIKSKLREEMERLEEKFMEIHEKELEEAKNDMAEKVDTYLSYVVQEWMKQNEMAVEHKMKTEIAESFITGLKTLFDEHNIAVPDEQYDMLDAAAGKVDELEGKLNETLEQNIELTKENGELKRNEILLDVASDLADTEVEKFAELTESIEYESEEDYREKVNTIKESYFPKATAKSDDNTTAGTETDDLDVSDTMAAYLSAITKTHQRANGKAEINLT